ncbi:MAG: hypothetical protein CSA21_06505 [Deltaproteobacteria bacterium]|nr:MAG: hypothetical protein CSA21_06505 [Deltaproteobacteria bacterium]
MKNGIIGNSVLITNTTRHEKGVVRIFNVLMTPLCVCLLVLLTWGCQRVDHNEELMDQGNKAMSQGRFQDAQQAFQQYLQHAPTGKDRWQAWQRLVTIQHDIRKDMDRANKLLATMYLEFKSDPTRTAHILMQQAQVSTALGDTEAALAYLEKGRSLPNLSPRDTWNLLMAQAQTAIRAHQFSLAHTVLSAGLGQAPNQEDHIRAVYLDGLALVYLGEHEQACQRLAKPFETMPHGPLWARFGLTLADIAEHQARYKDALTLLRQIKSSYPNPRVLEVRERALQRKIASTY